MNIEDRVRILENDMMLLRDGTLGWETNIKARAYLSANQENIANTTYTKVALNTESYDPGVNFNTTLNRFIAPIPGYYQINAAIYWTAIVADKTYIVVIYKNGVATGIRNRCHSSNVADTGQCVADIIHLNKDDYIELYCYHDAGVGTVDIAGTDYGTYMSIHLLSKD